MSATYSVYCDINIYIKIKITIMQIEHPKTSKATRAEILQAVLSQFSLLVEFFRARLNCCKYVTPSAKSNNHIPKRRYANINTTPYKPSLREAKVNDGVLSPDIFCLVCLL